MNKTSLLVIGTHSSLIVHKRQAGPAWHCQPKNVSLIKVLLFCFVCSSKVLVNYELILQWLAWLCWWWKIIEHLPFCLESASHLCKFQPRNILKHQKKNSPRFMHWHKFLDVVILGPNFQEISNHSICFHVFILNKKSHRDFLSKIFNLFQVPWERGPTIYHQALQFVHLRSTLLPGKVDSWKVFASFTAGPLCCSLGAWTCNCGMVILMLTLVICLEMYLVVFVCFGALAL